MWAVYELRRRDEGLDTFIKTGRTTLQQHNIKSNSKNHLSQVATRPDKTLISSTAMDHGSLALAAVMMGTPNDSQCLQSGECLGVIRVVYEVPVGLRARPAARSSQLECPGTSHAIDLEKCRGYVCFTSDMSPSLSERAFPVQSLYRGSWTNVRQYCLYGRNRHAEGTQSK